jgi:mersacidin/lichenicidin family type 2 lantibiotic
MVSPPVQTSAEESMKKNIDVARAWRDEDYFQSLSEEERASLGAHPAGALVDNEVLKSITGGCAYTGLSAACSPCPPYWCN